MKNMRFTFILSLLLCLFFLRAEEASAQAKPDMTLETYQWKNRLLLVFAPATNHDDYEQQIAGINKAAKGVKDRDLLVFELAAGGKQEAQREELLKQFDVKPGAYTLILLGKDGQEKYRSQQPIGMDEIFRIIDQMPMRQQEMRKQD
jgi:hypothetical protein